MKFTNIRNPYTSALSPRETQAVIGALETFASEVFPALTQGSFLLAWKEMSTDELNPRTILSFNLPQGAFRCNFSAQQQELSSEFV